MANGSGYSINLPPVFSNVIDYFKTHHAFDGLSMNVLIWWGILVAVWLMIAFWHQHQNKAFHEYIKNKKARTTLSDRLSQLAYTRSNEVIALFFLLIVIVIFYDTRVNQAENNVAELTAEQAELQLAATDLENQMVELQAELAVAQQLQNMPEGMELSMDAIKEKYEELFVSYYYLKRCGVIDKRDFHLMNAALIYELTELNAPAGIRKNILTAARGTHDELYAEASCDAETVGPMQEQIRSYVRTTMDQLPDQ